MREPDPKILLVDDTPVNLHALADSLRSEQYELHTADDGEAAWGILDQDPSFDLVLLDLMMPRLDGMSLLRRLKGDPRFRFLQVILQTADAAPERIAEGIQAGAFYYLTKPLNLKVLRSVVRAALDSRKEVLDVEHRLAAKIRGAGLLRRGEFQYRSPAEARDLAALLASGFPDPEAASVGVWELLINAVEHGNLEITYAEKTRFMQERRMLAEVAERLERPVFKDRVARAIFERDERGLSLTVEDEGPGFDWKPYLMLSADRAFHTHGRGIAMARAVSFHEITYEGRGNKVVARLGLA